jgi:hypothetical protein
MMDEVTVGQVFSEYLGFPFHRLLDIHHYPSLLRGIVDAPWYIRNDNLHKALDVATVDSVNKQYVQRHEQRLHRHINVEAVQLLHNDGLVRRLQRTKPFELV